MTVDDPVPFRPRPPWLTGDLQTIRNMLRRDAPDPGPFVRLWLDLPDGDALAAAWHAGDGSRPSVVLIHGLTGCEDSQYMRRSAAFWRARGHGVVRLNLRGSAPSLARSTRPYHAAAGGDIVAALAALPEAVRRPGLIVIGVSLGGTQLLNALGRDEARALPIIAAATICAPVLLAPVARRIMAPRNALYHRWLLRQMQREAEALAPHLPARLLAAARSARTVYAFDDGYVAPLAGFAGADDYYAHASLPRHLDRIAVPTLCLTAADDPWVPADTYRALDWRANPQVAPLIAPGGGHVGFHDRMRDGTWADRTIAARLSVYLRVSG
ncbi:alpha/beta fold hydrolase [Elioraea sp. Yellowstone]|jgi:predicted alpha/beta-fold hydrolase|uniref:YheT family hydrolase n=1 Tax=Elioraea sp. Yellowstone TaxID=2592070 RepID=UPI0011526A6A|nr:alpha/beta fold hydrolase [Elioraea sp. Yellowstone]TQF82023.1 alpha/beta fold hydrolase [Elioraea sp. Yellowstone]